MTADIAVVVLNLSLGVIRLHPRYPFAAALQSPRVITILTGSAHQLGVGKIWALIDHDSILGG